MFLFNLDECKKNMDIAILADISQSMKETDRNQLIEIVNKLVDQLGVSEAGNHFGLITFGDGATLHNNFANKYYQIAQNFKKSVTDELTVVPEKEGTRTDLAENQALTKLFTEEGGDRPNATNVMLIFTDGLPYIARWDRTPKIPFPELTAALEVNIFSFNLITPLSLHIACYRMLQVS